MERKDYELITWTKNTAGEDPGTALHRLLQEKDAMTEDLEEWQPALQQAYQDQHKIGWRNLPKGRVVTTWVPAIREYLQAARSCRQPTTWVEDLISKLLEITHHM